MAVAADELCRKLEDMANVENSELSQELEVLKEIYITELSINHDASGHFASIDVQLHPATGENVSQKWVCLTLQLLPPPDYPHSIPEICIRGPRGLADEHVVSLKKKLYHIAEDRKGEPMMYELIESAKESLTQLNVPYGQCMICLDDFSGSHKEFTKTDCYHYFHCDCLALYIDHCKTELEAPEPSNTFINKEVSKQIVCPVCRELLPCDLNLSAFLPESGAGVLNEKYVPSEEMQELQIKMADLYEKQKQKGGIIDLEEERNKYLLPKDFVYAGSMEESSQDTLLSESVQPLSALKANDRTLNYNKYPQHQGQRDYRKRGRYKGIREQEQGGRGARKNREEYVMERSEYNREEDGSESREYSRKQGEYVREQGKHAREEGYRTRQGQNHGVWQNKEGSRNRQDRSNRFLDLGRPRNVRATASEIQNKNAGSENVSSEKMEQVAETEQGIETENSRQRIDVNQENQVEGSSDVKVEDRALQITMKNSTEKDRTTFKGKQAPEKSGNFHRRYRRREHDHHDQRVEEEIPGRYLQKSQDCEGRYQDVLPRRPGDGECSKKSPELLNCSEQSVKEIEIPQKANMINGERQTDTNVEAPLKSRNHGDKIHGNWKSDKIHSCHGKSESVRMGSLYSNRKPGESGNRQRWQSNHRQDQDPDQYKKDCSRSNSLKKDEVLKDKTLDEVRDISKDRASLGKASTLPDQLKDLVDGQLCGTSMQDLNANASDIPHGKKTSAPKQSSRHDNHYKSRLHARENTMNGGSMEDRHECCASANGTNQENLQMKFQSRPKTVTDRETMEHVGEKTTNRRNHKNPQCFEAESHPKEGRQFNDRQKVRKDANVETLKVRNETSESQSTQNDLPISNEPRSLLGTTNLKSSHCDRSNDAHPGFHVRSISTVNTELVKTLDS